MQKILALLFLCISVLTQAQETFPYNGVRPKEVTAVAFTHATLVVDPTTVIQDATLVIEKGYVIAAGAGVAIPTNAVVYDLHGQYIYPSFIDVYSGYGMPKSPPAQREWRRAQTESNRKGAFGWNEAIKADQDAGMVFTTNEEQAAEYRGIGFGAVLTHMQDGIARGTGALVGLGVKDQTQLYQNKIGAFYSFNKGTSQQDYPSSLMGSIALLRQTYYDAEWYAREGKKEERNLSLEAFAAQRKGLAIFDAGNKWNVLRADKVGDEFGVQYVFKTAGNEYQRIDEMRKTGGTMIVPLNFPKAYDVSDPLTARWIDLGELKHWEMAPANAAMLRQAGIPFVFTASDLMEKKDFLPNLRRAVLYGLSEQDALAALTTAPAKLIGTEQTLGQLKKGFRANFFIATGNIFNDESKILESWVDGDRFEVSKPEKESIAGDYVLESGNVLFKIHLEDGEKGKNSALVLREQNGQVDSLTFSVKYNTDMMFMNMTLKPDSAAKDMGLRLFSGWKLEGQWTGWMEDGAGAKAEASLRAVKSSTAATKEKEKSEKKQPEVMGKMIYPFTAFGWEQKPVAKTVLVRNATIWTNEEEGIIENGEILISAGKIVGVGKSVNAAPYKDVEVIDGTGLHVTCGIIDEHSHIALESVNEGSQASSAEVKEASVIWPEDIDIYRQLSGGVVASQLLHGSANPIGGQSAMIKLRWGASADEMLIAGADGFIKFALGENVKQSNWGDFNTTRFPQTRMGVEQVYYDHFIRAREYAAAWKAYFGASPGQAKKGMAPAVAPRRDLELDALAEILEHRRFITCHSYVQSEINMLMHVADSMGFRINTFTHILEGYKLSDKMREHGAAASTFSDWWAYKMEVKDAIPYNGALMWRDSLTVAFNSDDAEMARRLNQEAAKAVKYGGVPEEEAWKFVTLNPAKMLHLDQRMGSLKAGKDADIVIWTAHPMSIYARAMRTYVDGICYYDMEAEQGLLLWMEQERARIIRKMLDAKNAGEPVVQPVFKSQKHFHCDTMDATGMGVFNH
jgi:imidazolonepropionase-like amidohydrolase